MKLKGVILIAGLCIISLFYACSKDNKKVEIGAKNESDAISEIEKIEKVELEKLSEDEKIKIARELFDEYINENRTDKKMVESQKLNREPVVALTDYRIKHIDFIDEHNDTFTVDVQYDIQYTNDSNMWVAGNGELSDNNWVIDKCNFLDIKKAGDKYIITNIYTG